MDPRRRDPRRAGYEPPDSGNKRRNSDHSTPDLQRKANKTAETASPSKRHALGQRSASSHELPNREIHPSRLSLVQSPNSAGSATDGVANTTAFNNHSTIPSGVAPVANMTMTTADLATPNMQTFMKQLALFHENSTQVVKHQIAKDDAETRLQTAIKQYDTMAPHFASYPAVKEQKTKAKAVAQKSFNDKQATLSVYLQAQERISGQMAATIFRAATKADSQPQPVEPIDRVSRAEYDALATREAELEKKVIGMQTVTASIGGLHTRIDKIDSAISKFNTDLGEHTEKFDKLKKTPDDMRSILDSKPAMSVENQERLDKLWIDKTKFMADLKSLKEEAKDLQENKTAVIADLEVLKDKANLPDENKGTLVADLQELKQNVKQLQKSEAAFTIDIREVKENIQTPRSLPSVNEPTGRFDNYEARLSTLASKVEAFYDVVRMAAEKVVADQTEFTESETQKLDERLATLEANNSAANHNNVDTVTTGNFDKYKAFTANKLLKIEEAQNSLREKQAQSAQQLNAGLGRTEQALQRVKDSVKTDTTSVLEEQTTSLREILNVMRADFIKMLAEKADRKDVSQLRGKSADRLAQSNTPQFAAVQPVIPNGTNGVNGHAAASNRPPNDAQVWARMDQLGHFINRIQGQYDNLTTEKVAAHILGQIGQLYPHLKDAQTTQAAVNALRSDFDKLRAEVTDLRKTASSDLARHAQSTDRMGGDVDDLKQGLQAHGEVTDGVIQNTGTLTKRADNHDEVLQKREDDMREMDKRLTTLGEQIGELEGTMAVVADEISK